MFVCLFVCLFVCFFMCCYMIPFAGNFDCTSAPKVKLVSLAEAVHLMFQNCLSGFLS
jgi:hypothetical protein